MKPLVSILMAVYKPNEEWLVKQLNSLNDQEYENIELIIWDDCPEAPMNEAIVRNCITRFPYRLIRGTVNLGSTKVFEKLTELGEGRYLAYCDQDDIWCRDKISRCVSKLEETGSPLVCSDMHIIDGEGSVVAHSFSYVNKRHQFYEGEGLAPRLLMSNFVVGCTMLIRSEIAKAAIPFEESFVHDHWLALYASLHGSIESLTEPLLYYRRHAANQTGLLNTVEDKNSYYQVRILELQDRITATKSRLGGFQEVRQRLDELSAWMRARSSYFRRANYESMKTMWRYRGYNKSPIYFELLSPLIPNAVFRWVIRLVKKGIL